MGQCRSIAKRPPAPPTPRTKGVGPIAGSDHAIATPTRVDAVPEEQTYLLTSKDLDSTSYTVPVDQLQGELSQAQEGYTASKFAYEAHGTLQNLFRFRGTVLPGLIARPTFWASLLIYSTTCVCHRGYPKTCGAKYLSPVNIGDLKICGVLVTFFLAFYSNQCFKRYQSQYTNLKRIEGHMRSVGIQVKAFFKGNRAAYNMIETFRFLSAAYYLLFARLYNGDRVEVNLDTALAEGLVSVEEKLVLQKHSPGMRWFKALGWVFEHITQVHNEKACDASNMRTIQKEILSIRDTMNKVTFEAQMPIPLAYFHVVLCLCTAFSLLFSYACPFMDATTSPVLISIVWAMVVCGYLGMREVAVQMAEPFGDDDSDLPVDNYVHNIRLFLTKFVEDEQDDHLHADNKPMTFVNTNWMQVTSSEPKKINKVLVKGRILQNERFKQRLIKRMRRHMLGPLSFSLEVWRSNAGLL